MNDMKSRIPRSDSSLKITKQPPTIVRMNNPNKNTMVYANSEKPYTIGTVWINKTSRRIYMLANINAKEACWVLIGGKK